MGTTMNMIVLFALILALGMLVDNAIVVIENIHRLYNEEGLSKFEAAKKGVGEIAIPIISSTATTLAAFFPLLFWDDMMGEFMGYIPMTLIIVLGSSLLHSSSTLWWLQPLLLRTIEIKRISIKLEK